MRCSGAQWRQGSDDVAHHKGHVLGTLVQRHRDKSSAKTFFRKLLQGCEDVPRAIIIAQLTWYGAATREILPSVEHWPHRHVNSRAEPSHQPTPLRERRLQGWKSPRCTERFPATYGLIASHFHSQRYLLPALNTVKSWGKDSAPDRTSRGSPHCTRVTLRQS